MKAKQRNNLLQALAMTLIFIGLAIYFINDLHYIFLFGSLIVPWLIALILKWIIPVKEVKKSSRKKVSPKSQPISKTKTNPTINVPTTRLLPDKEILTLPLEQLSGTEFERLCFLYYKVKGYKPKETSKGADGGVDLLIYQRYHNDYEAVQIKHYINSGTQITVREIRELNSAKQNHGCVLARFITSTTYSKDAMLQADKWNIKTHGIEWVMNKIEPWRKEEAKKKLYA